MTHMKEMEEHEGTFSPPEDKKYPCQKCGAVEAICRLWESSCGGFEDYQYTCKTCKHVWWVDGIDS